MTSVLQDWVMDLPLKMQSVLMTATRGPDNERFASIKVGNRWCRQHLFHDADPSNPFIVKPGDPQLPEILDRLARELEYTTVHYFGHFIHAFEIIGYKHPEPTVRALAMLVYSEMCAEVLHLPVESLDGMNARLVMP